MQFMISQRVTKPSVGAGVSGCRLGSLGRRGWGPRAEPARGTDAGRLGNWTSVAESIASDILTAGLLRFGAGCSPRRSYG